MRFEEAYTGWDSGTLSQEEAARLLGVCPRTFRRYVGRYEEDGQFGSGGGGAAKTTSPEEKQKKIDSVKNIDLDQDSTLPNLNAETLEGLGQEDKPVLLKKDVIDRNFERHSDLTEEEFKSLLGQSLYDPDFIKRSERPDRPDYYHFVKHLERDNSVVLLEMTTSKDNHEIVHVLKMNDKNLGKL